MQWPWAQSTRLLEYTETTPEKFPVQLIKESLNTDKGTNAERTDVKKQVWMKNTKQLQIGEVDQSREDGFHMASQI